MTKVWALRGEEGGGQFASFSKRQEEETDGLRAELEPQPVARDGRDKELESDS